MKNTPYSRMKGSSRSRRGSLFEGDMAVYLRTVANDNEDTLCRLKRNLRAARRQELTPRQSQVLRMYFEEEMTMTAIGEVLGISKSTVSRTIARAKGRLQRCLRYSL